MRKNYNDNIIIVTIVTRTVRPRYCCTPLCYQDEYNKHVNKHLMTLIPFWRLVRISTIKQRVQCNTVTPYPTDSYDYISVPTRLFSIITANVCGFYNDFSCRRLKFADRTWIMVLRIRPQKVPKSVETFKFGSIVSFRRVFLLQF